MSKLISFIQLFKDKTSSSRLQTASKYSLCLSIKYSSFNNIHDIANLEKKVPLEWIDQENNYVKDELIDYIRPLIIGEVKQYYKDGVPEHLIRKD